MKNVERMIKCSKNLIKKKKKKKQKSDGLDIFNTRSILMFVHYWQPVENRVDRD